MSVEKELGALQEGLKNISAQLEKAEEGRKNVYQRLEGMDRKVDHLDWRMVAIENKLTSMNPTIEKVERIQIQAEGVSKFGSFVSKAGFFVFTLVSGVLGYFANYITWK